MQGRGESFFVTAALPKAGTPACGIFPGGHIEAGETPSQALRRELREELGIDADVPSEARFVFTDDDGPSTLELHAFAVTSWDGVPHNAAPVEHDEIRWFSSGEAQRLDLAHPRLRDFLTDGHQVGLVGPLTPDNAAVYVACCGPSDGTRLNP